MADDGGGLVPDEAAWVNPPALTRPAARRGFVVRVVSDPPNWALANARADAALKRHMTPSQRVSWKARDWCWVDSQEGRRYKLFKSWTYNVREYQKCGCAWRPIACWCLSARSDVPVADLWLMQLLYLKYSEAAFRMTANRQVNGNI